MRCLQALLIGAAKVAGHLLERHRINWMSEAGTAILTGVLVGAAATLLDPNENGPYYDLLKFNVRICTDHFQHARARAFVGASMQC